MSYGSSSSFVTVEYVYSNNHNVNIPRQPVNTINPTHSISSIHSKIKKTSQSLNTPNNNIPLNNIYPVNGNNHNKPTSNENYPHLQVNEIKHILGNFEYTYNLTNDDDSYSKLLFLNNKNFFDKFYVGDLKRIPNVNVTSHEKENKFTILNSTIEHKVLWDCFNTYKQVKYRINSILNFPNPIDKIKSLHNLFVDLESIKPKLLNLPAGYQCIKDGLLSDINCLERSFIKNTTSHFNQLKLSNQNNSKALQKSFDSLAKLLDDDLSLKDLFGDEEKIPLKSITFNKLLTELERDFNIELLHAQSEI